jgi:hypothetical protein
MADEVEEIAAAQSPELARIQQLTNQALSRSSSEVTPISSLDHLRVRNFAQDISLKKTYATATLIGVGAQLAIADAAFFVYLGDTSGAVPAAVMDVWLSATVVQVVGIILVITNYLFPRRLRGDEPPD